MHPRTPGRPHLWLVRHAPAGLPAGEPGRLGVLGGAYNPITLAHLAMADTARAAFGLHEVLFLLPQAPPHKPLVGATLEQRLDMMQLAVADRPYAAVGLCSHGLFIEIYEALAEVYRPLPEVFFLTGRDAAERVLTWPYDDAEAALRQMFTAFQLIVCDRNGAFVLPDDPRLAPYRHRIHRCVLPPPYRHISSTAVRERCRQGLPIDDLVPAVVAAYIEQHRLYRNG
ncbi:MAG: putative nicotinate-nucleotide adenylyltransferase [Candidatus Tectimicrobiota bacterium]|nr:MAG: putative nicotinate-nucleotide adenylyltransferase [Candidatus Tectomicrobia bacterium]